MKKRLVLLACAAFLSTASAHKFDFENSSNQAIMRIMSRHIIRNKNGIRGRVKELMVAAVGADSLLKAYKENGDGKALLMSAGEMKDTLQAVLGLLEMGKDLLIETLKKAGVDPKTSSLTLLIGADNQVAHLAALFPEKQGGQSNDQGKKAKEITEKAEKVAEILEHFSYVRSALLANLSPKARTAIAGEVQLLIPNFDVAEYM